MTNLLEIKPYIHDFIEENLDSAFADKVYWIGERKIVPEYPYCLLNVIVENKDKRTSHHLGDITEIDTREDITTRYKTCTITIGVYNGWTDENDNDMDEVKEFTYEQIDRIEGAFENYPINNKFSIQNISAIRPLHQVVDGGYLYRYEFDLMVGYNEETIINKPTADNIEVEFNKIHDLNSAGADNNIHFVVEVDNETITVENLI